MQEKHLFEYAVLRVVPRVEREEFINVGVVLYCKEEKYLNMLYHLREECLLSFSAISDLTELKENLSAFEKICVGNPSGGPIASLPLAERFRWLTATRSTVIQSSKVHPGLCTDAAKQIKHLYEQLVL